MTRGHGTCWPATVTPPLSPSLTFVSTWSVGRKFYTGSVSVCEPPSLCFLDCEPTCH